MEQENQVLINSKKCNGCGLCVTDCQRRVLEIRNKKAVITNPVCLKCGHCLAVCPANAVKLSGYSDKILEMPKEPVFLDEKSLMTHLKFRRSIRRYKDTPIEKKKLEKIIEAGRITPTASNLQNVRYIILQKEKDAVEDAVLEQYKGMCKPNSALKRKLKIPFNFTIDRVKRGFLFHNAPVVILIVSPSEINACLAAMSMELMAEALGIGVVYIGLFTRPANINKELRKSLGIAEEEQIAACLTLGYSSVKYLRSVPRKKANVEWR